MSIQYVLGFTNEYYTLWSIDYCSDKKEHNFIQNLSKNFDKAKDKLSNRGIKYCVDLDLKGQFAWQDAGESYQKNSRDKGSDIFVFGKYEGQQIASNNDIKYLMWYYDETSNQFAKENLLKKGFVEDAECHQTPKSLYSHEDLLEVKENRKFYEFRENLQNGHHYEDGKRLELELFVLESYSFKGKYGRCYSAILASKCGKCFKYLGSSLVEMPTDRYEYLKVMATVCHSYYDDQEETRLKRIKVL